MKFHTLDKALEALATTTTLTSVKLHHINIDEEGAKFLAVALEKNTTLTFIEFGWSNIDHEGVKALAIALEKNKTLTSIGFAYSHIGDEGAKVLATALEKNTILTFIDLEYNSIGIEGAKVLATALEKNTTLTEIHLLGNNLGDEGAKAIATALEKNTALTGIDLENSNIGDEGAKALATALKKNIALTTIYLADNKIGDEGAKALATGLEKNTSLTWIGFSHWNVSDETINNIRLFLRRNRKNTYLKAYNMIGQKEEPHKVLAALKTALELAKSIRQNNKKYIKESKSLIQLYEILCALEKIGIYGMSHRTTILESLVENKAAAEEIMLAYGQDIETVITDNPIIQTVQQVIRIIGVTYPEFIDKVRKPYLQLYNCKHPYAKEALSDVKKDMQTTGLLWSLSNNWGVTRQKSEIGLNPAPSDQSVSNGYHQ